MELDVSVLTVFRRGPSADARVLRSKRETIRGVLNPIPRGDGRRGRAHLP